MYARRSRALLTALALTAFTIAAVPVASPAAAPKRVAPSAAPKRVAKPAPKKTAYRPHNGPAPADEYFGRLQMSILGVRNKVKDLGLDADYHPEHESAILGNAIWVEDAMRDWAKKYPFDKWLPRYAYALEEMYERLPGPDAHRRAVKQVAYLTAYFPQTVYGKIGREKYALGVPQIATQSGSTDFTELERLALIDGKVAPTMPPAPTPAPTPTPAASAAPTPAADRTEAAPGP